MKKVQLGTVIHSLNTGLNPRKFFQLNTPDAEFYYVTIKEMVDGKIVYNENTDRLNENALQLCNRRSNLEKGDVLFSGTGTIGKTVVLTETPTTWNIKEGVYTIKPKQDLLNSNYLSYVLSSESIKNNYMTNVAGGTVKSLKMADLEKTEIPLPPLPEQQKIVAELDTIQSAIDSKKQQLALLDEAVKSKFVEMFGNPDINPKGFPVKKINDFANCTAGATPSTKIQEYWENGTIPWMSSGEVHKGRIFDTDIKISKLGYDSCSTKMIPEHTVVIALAGQGKTRGTVGVAEIALCTNQSLCAIITNETINTDYLYSYLQLKYEDLRRISNGDGGRGGLNLKLVGNFEVMIPDIALQDRWGAFVQQIEKSKFVIKQQIVDLQELLNSKMQEYFS